MRYLLLLALAGCGPMPTQPLIISTPMTHHPTVVPKTATTTCQYMGNGQTVCRTN